MALNNVADEHRRKLAIVLISALIFLASPVLVAVVSIFWLYRYFLILWKETWHPELGSLYHGLDSIFSNESPYTKEQLTNIGYYLTVQDRIDLDDFRSQVQKGLDLREQNASDNDKGQINRRLRQVLRKWGGYYIGEDEKNFKVKDHVRIFNLQELNQRIEEQCEPQIEKLHFNKKFHEEHLSEDELSELNYSLIRIPYKTQMSPWEILLLYNPNPEAEPDGESKAGISKLGANRKWTTVVILRLHHSIGDGISIACLFSHFLDQSQEFSVGRILNNFSKNTVDTKGNSRRSLVGHLLSIVKATAELALGVPYFVSYWLTCLHESWPPITLDLKENRPCHTFTFEFSKQKVRELQNRCGSKRVSSTSVLMTTAAMSFSDFFKQYSKMIGETLSSTILPQQTMVSESLGGQRGRHELTNHLTLIGVKVPFGSIQAGVNTREIVREIEQSYLFAKNSRACQVEKMCLLFYGLLPVRLRPPIFVTTKAFGMSYVPCFEKPVTILGKPVISVRATTAIPELPYICIFVMTNHDKLHVTLTVAKKFIDSRAEAQKLAKCFEKKFEYIYQDLTQRHAAQTK